METWCLIPILLDLGYAVGVVWISLTPTDFPPHLLRISPFNSLARKNLWSKIWLSR